MYFFKIYWLLCSLAAIVFFKEELYDYKTNEKNTIQFLFDQELLVEVKKIVRFRIEENRK